MTGDRAHGPNNVAAIDPAPLMRLSTGYWDSQTLLTANRIGVFEVLAPGSLGLAEAAEALGTRKRQTALLLNACVALGLLEMDGERYRNSPLSDAFLVPGKEAYLGNALRYSDNMYAAWGDLERALREGAPPMRPETYLGKDPEQTRQFVYGMHNRALGVGRALVGLLDLSGRRRMLDVGGGPGTYSALLTARYPDLRALVLDLPEVAAVAREILASMAAEDRVEVMPGDYKTTEFPSGNDAVLISGVFHRETETACRDLIERASRSLAPGGMLIVSDVFTEAGGTGPAFAALFGLNMALSATDGGVHADTAVAGWMTQAGFDAVDVTPFPPPLPHRVVVGRKHGSGT